MVLGNATVDGQETEVAMAIGDLVELWRDDGGAMAITVGAVGLSEEEDTMVVPTCGSLDLSITGASAMPRPAMTEDGALVLPTDDPRVMPIVSATSMPIDGTMAVPVDGAIAIPVDGAMAVLVDGAMAIASDGATAMPKDGAMAIPEDGAMAIASEGAIAMPNDGAMAVSVDGAMAIDDDTPMTVGGATACEPTITPVDLCRICGQRHLLDENHEYNYKDEVDDELLCHICLQALIRPLDTPCGHTYCQECLTSFLLESDFCPVDRVPLLLQNCRKSSLLVHKLLDKLTVSCPFSDHCSEQMARGELQGHIQSRLVNEADGEEGNVPELGTLRSVMHTTKVCF